MILKAGNGVQVFDPVKNEGENSHISVKLSQFKVIFLDHMLVSIQIVFASGGFSSRPSKCHIYHICPLSSISLPLASFLLVYGIK